MRYAQKIPYTNYLQFLIFFPIYPVIYLLCGFFLFIHSKPEAYFDDPPIKNPFEKFELPTFSRCKFKQ